ncbi:MAG: hpnD [Gammaproteobacteria bacterium]|jgi:phytoene synthase|nr:hpnD [Gammaproteobacteria bacterium]
MNDALAAPGSDLYYSWLFLDEAKKDAVIKLYTFCDTLSQMLALKENDIFLVKWAWWQQEIAQMLLQKATHPAARALQSVIAQYKLPPALLQDYLDGIKLTRELNHCCTEEDFNAYSYRTRGIKQSLAAYIYGFRDPTVLHYIRAMAVALSLMDEILHIGRNIKKDRVFLPLTVLPTWQNVSNKEIHAILNSQVQKALADYKAALLLLPAAEHYTQHPSLIEAKLKSQQLLLNEKDFSALLHSYSKLTPLRKYLTAWRFKRKLSRYDYYK